MLSIHDVTTYPQRDISRYPTEHVCDVCGGKISRRQLSRSTPQGKERSTRAPHYKERVICDIQIFTLTTHTILIVLGMLTFE